tara:strand:+ start:4463 stop:5485 length:1023 start_codon:yes stop_codon:yes gene_type:complete
MFNKKTPKIIFINISLIFLIFAFLEIVARLFSNAIVFGNSKNLFDTSNKNYIKNCKSCEAKSFGQRIYTNEFGYRSSSLNTVVNSELVKEKIIIIGDSVAFGPGVMFEETFQGLLSDNFIEYSFINRSVIGHSLYQHLQTANLIRNDNKKIKKVYLIYCLNDISDISSYEIIKNSIPNKIENNWVYKIKKNRFVLFINKQLRDKSILYMLIKGILTKPQERYFFSDFKNYLLKIDNLNINKLKEINEIFKQKNIELTVIISPYEYQVRNAEVNNNLLLPQRFLKVFLKKNKIIYIDAYPKFLESGFKSSDLFLPYDPMHLSAKGHRILFEIVQKDLMNSN